VAQTSRLRRFNNFLSIIAVLLALYILALPLLPNLTFWWRSHGHAPPVVTANAAGADKSNEPIPKDNTLVIPKLQLQEPIFDGADASTLSKGVWHRPNTSTPDKGSNMAMAGHRFDYYGPAVFYHLDKLTEGDTVIVYWQQKKYVYTVNRILIVPPTGVEVEAPTSDSIVTLYTCTPLWTARSRLVVQAKLKEQAS
jgi:sortase A